MAKRRNISKDQKKASDLVDEVLLIALMPFRSKADARTMLAKKGIDEKAAFATVPEFSDLFNSLPDEPRRPLKKKK